jgi:sugar-specific transcriptional regulator TrmB
MNPINKPFITLLVLLASVLGVGCGSDDDSMSAAEFTQQANAVCKRVGNERVAALQKLEKSGTRPEDLDPAALQKVNDEVVIAPIREVASELSDLSFPPEGSAKYEQVVEGYESLLSEVEGSEVNMLVNPSPEISRKLEDVRKSAKKAGLKVCAQF